jgi:hypothetical protein
MTVDVTTTQNPVTVSVNDTNVSVSVTDNVTTATVSGGTGPQGPSGGTSPATTTTIGGIIVGSGLTVTADGTLSSSGAVSSVAGRTGAVTLTTADVGGLGTVATLDVAAAGNATTSQVVKGNDTRLSDSRTPSSTLLHASTHAAAGSDPVTLSTSQITGLGSLATQSGTFSGTSSGTNTGDQTITLTGDVTGSGTGSFSATLAASGATAGTYTSVTVDTKGRVTSGTNPAGYSLPTATASVLGGIKIGSGLTIDGAGVVTAAGTYTLPNATTSTLGGVIVGSGLSVSSGTVSANVTSVAGRTGAVTIASGDVSGLATVATSASASDLSAGTLSDARLSNSIVSAMGMSGSVVDVLPRLHCANTYQGLTSGIIFWTFFTPQKTITVDRITMATGSTASASLTLARMGLYTFDETTATLVARTASDTTLFNATASAFTKIFDTAGGYPASYQLVAGTRYGVAVICTGSTMPTMVCDVVNTAIGALTPRIFGYRTSQSDLLTTNTSFSIASSNPIWARLS